MKMQGTKYTIGNGKYIPFPEEALEGLKGTAKAAILVLLALSKELEEDPQAEIDTERLMKSTGCDKDDIDDALHYWQARGILKENGGSVIRASLTAALGREPADYEANRLTAAVKESGLDADTAARIIKLSAYREAARRVSWAEGAVKEMGKLSDPLQKTAELERYYSLTEMIRTGFPITRKFTQAEKQIICSWAARRIPLNIIFNAYAVSQPIAHTVSFQHMNKLLEKAVIPETADDELGY